MKKIFALFTAILFAGSMMYATEASVDFSNKGYTNGQAIVSVALDAVVSVSFDKGTNSNNAPKYYTTGEAIRCYAGNTFTVSAKNANLTQVALTFGSSDGSNEITTNVGTYSNGTWTGEAAEVVFTISGSTGNRRLATMTVNYTSTEAPDVEAPEFSVKAGSYYEAQTVTLTCATEGAEIHYTLDGTEPTAASTLYTAALTIAKTTTVKAIAVKGSKKSDVVTKEYVIAEHYASLSELVEKAGTPAGQKVIVDLTDEEIVDIYVTTQDKRNGVYVMAGDRKLEIYCYDVPEDWVAGGTLSGTLKGDWKNYNDQWEVCPASWEGLTYTAPATAWDGTISLSKTEFRTLEDLEGLTLTFNGATAVALAEEPEYILFQNEDGSEMYAIWNPNESYGGTYIVDGNTIKLYNWSAQEALPAVDCSVYFEDYGTFSIDGVEDYFDTYEASYIAPVPTTYTVTYSVTGLVAEYCRVQAGYINADMTVSELFVEGENTVPEDMYAYVYAQVIEDYTVEVKVNGEVVELAEGIWNSEDPITADMTIDVVFKNGKETSHFEVLKYSNFTQDVAGATGYQNFTYESDLDITYSAHMMYQASQDQIQLRSTQTSNTYYAGIVSSVVPAGMYIKSVKVEWEASTTDTRQLNIFTVDSPLAINDMFARGATPDYTTLKSAGDKTIDVTGQHRYIGICSQAGAMFVKAITIEWVSNGTSTAVDNTIEAVKATKVMVNGQVMIIRDGKTYNVMGMQY